MNDSFYKSDNIRLSLINSPDKWYNVEGTWRKCNKRAYHQTISTDRSYVSNKSPGKKFMLTQHFKQRMMERTGLSPLHFDTLLYELDIPVIPITGRKKVLGEQIHIDKANCILIIRRLSSHMYKCITVLQKDNKDLGGIRYL